MVKRKLETTSNEEIIYIDDNKQDKPQRTKNKDEINNLVTKTLKV